MRKKTALFIGLSLVLAAITLGTTGCEGFTSPSPRTSSGSGALVSQQNTGIWVTGEGKVTAVPDLAILSLGVESQATTVAEAQNQAASAMDAVMGELDRYGIARKDIQTRYFSVYPVRNWVEDKEVLVGYRVTNTVTVKVRNVKDSGIIIDSISKAGGDNIRINNINFTVDDPAAYQREAREKAMDDAEAKAKQLAGSGGVKLGKPTYINESGGFIPAPPVIYRAEAAFPAPAPSPVTTISPGETEIMLTVQVVYSIN